MITSWRPAPSGTSGAISTRGTLGALAGAGTMGLMASLGTIMGWWLAGRPIASVMIAVTAAGFAGALVDSVLGATVQSQYRCPRCDVVTEQSVHLCGTSTERRRGVRWVTNDVVNALAISAGAAALLGWFWLW